MSVYVRVFACVHLCVHVCMHVCMCVCACVCVCLYMCVCTYYSLLTRRYLAFARVLEVNNTKQICTRDKVGVLHLDWPPRWSLRRLCATYHSGGDQSVRDVPHS